MPYAVRNTQGHLVALLKEPALGADELLGADHPDVVAFLQGNESQSVKAALADTDQKIARVTEDLIHLLISKNLILFTELPLAVQQKLLERERLRSNLHGTVNNFLEEEESI